MLKLSTNAMACGLLMKPSTYARSVLDLPSWLSIVTHPRSLMAASTSQDASET
jgi:hypothetical protein